MANAVFQFIKCKSSESKVNVGGADGAAVITDPLRGFTRNLELLKKPLQWSSIWSI